MPETITRETEPLLRMRGVAKSFGAVVALESADLDVQPHSVHALVGENGAGKSTLVKIIAGLYRRDAGEFELSGETVDFHSTAESKAAGIAVIYQEPTFFPDLSVIENIFMGRQPAGRFGRIDRRRMREEATAILDRLGLAIDLDLPAAGLSIADQQIVEITKAISLDARLLIMDEPTAALSGVEVQHLFEIVRKLRDEGRGVVFISHRFDEVFDLCDTITVMRDGRHIATDPTAEVTEDEIVRRMVGRDVSELFPKIPAEIGEVVLEVNGLDSAGVFHDVSFTVRSGEIVALAGLVGAGRSEVARAVFGVDGYDSGSVTLAGKAIAASNPAAAMAAGLGLVPEDRRKQGLVLDTSVARNATLAIRKSLTGGGLLRSSRENAAARQWAGTLQLKSAALDSLAGTLSGGNQQKLVLAKWLASEPRVLIIDEPTRGIDIGTKAEVHRLISELAGQGMGILMISSELPEVLGMADRLLVMREGRITAEIDRADATAENVMYHATHGEGVPA